MRSARVVPLSLVVLALAGRAAVEGSTVVVRTVGGRDVDVVARLVSRTSSWSADARLASGTVALREVPSGDYELAVAGVRLGFRIAPAERVTVEVSWSADGSPRVRIARREEIGMRTAFEAEDLRLLPSGREVVSLLETAEPATVTDRIDGGGLWTAEPARLTAHGGSWTETTYVLDAVDVTDPLRGGRPLVLPPTDALAAATLVSAAAEAEAPGSAARVGLELPPPPAAWRGTIHADTTLGVPAASAPPALARLERWRDLGLIAGGPLGARRGGLRGAFDWRQSTRAERGDPETLPSRLACALGQAWWRATDRDTVRATAIGQWARRPPEPGLWRGGDAADEARVFAATHWERRRENGTLWAARLGYARMRTAGMTPAASIDRLQDGPLSEQVEERPAARARAEATLVFQPRPLAAGGAHDLRLTLTAARSAATLAPLTAAVGERVAAAPARVWEYAGGTPARPRAYDVALALSDGFTAGGLRADAGLRGEVVSGRDAGAPIGVRWWSLSPTLSVRWSALSRARLVLAGAAGRRAHRLPLSWLEWGDPAAPRAQVRRWTDADGDGVAEPAERGPVVGRAGPGAPAGSLDPHLRRPYTDELVLAVEGRLGDALTVRLTGLDRRASRLVESVNAGLGPGAYTSRFLPDPGGDLVGREDDQLLPVAERPAPGEADSLVLTNPPGLDARYRGVELAFDLRVRDRLRLQMAGTAHRVDGRAASRGFHATENDPGLVGELFDVPNADRSAEGRLFFDRAYTLKLSGRVRAPGDIHLGWVARYQDGQPFARLVVAADLPQGPDFVRAVPNGRHRFAYTLTVDARLEKGLTAGTRRLSVCAEAFNLLQTRHEVEEDVVSGPAFRTPTYVQPPRALRAGLRIDF